MKEFDELEQALEVLEQYLGDEEVLNAVRYTAPSAVHLANFCQRIYAILNSQLVEEWVMQLWPAHEERFS